MQNAGRPLHLVERVNPDTCRWDELDRRCR